MELAERLGRTRQELLFGSGAFEPLSMQELIDWLALARIRANEAKKGR